MTVGKYIRTKAIRQKVSDSRKGKCLGNQYAKGNKPNSTSFKKGEHKSIDTEFKIFQWIECSLLS